MKATLVFLGDFSNSEIKFVEECTKDLPPRVKPYVFVKQWGKILWKVYA